MLTVTEEAAAHLKTLKESSGEQGTLRMVVEQEQVTLRLEDEKQGDQVVKHDEDTVLLVSPEVDEALDGATLSCDQTDEGPRLSITR